MANDDVHPPKTILTLHVGVTGHRDLSRANDKLLRSQLDAVLAEIRSQVETIYRQVASLHQPVPPKLRLISPIAEGADRLVAHAALNLGYELQCPLPFSREEYERDFDTPDSQAEYRELLNQATAILELAGSREHPGEAYLAAGEIVLEQSDILIAVWDGSESLKKGGTAHIVQKALDQGLPVLWLPSVPPYDIHFGLPKSSNPASWQLALPDCLQGLLVPLINRDAPARDNPLTAYFQERQPSCLWGPPYTFFLKMLAFSRKKITPDQEAPKTLCRQPPPALPPALEAHFRWADTLAIFYANLYRNAYLSKYLFGFFAIMGLFLGSIGNNHWGLQILIPIGYAQKALFLILVLGLIFLENHGRWHKKFLDYRYLAELLRHLRYLYPIGQIIPQMQLLSQRRQDHPWVPWHLRAIVREIGLATTHLEAATLAPYLDYLQNREIQGQILYYRRTAASFRRLDTRLKYFGIWAFIIGVGIMLGQALVYWCCPVSSQDYNNYRNIFDELSLIIPAIGPALFGFKSQAEFLRLANQYDAKVNDLENLTAQFKELAASDQLSLTAVAAYARDAARIMLGEVADWRTVMKTRGLSYL